MQKLAEAPPLHRRGNILQRVQLVAQVDMVAEHLGYWVGERAKFGDEDLSVRANTPRVLAGRFAKLMELHSDLALTRLDLAWPLSDDTMHQFQQLSSAALGASALLRNQPVREYLGVAQQASPESPTPVCFDADDWQIRFHTIPGAEDNFIEGFEPDDGPEQWYGAPGYYVQVRKPAAATSETEAAYAAYFGVEFDPGSYSTITAVAASSALVPVSQVPIPDFVIRDRPQAS